MKMKKIAIPIMTLLVLCTLASAFAANLGTSDMEGQLSEFEMLKARLDVIAAKHCETYDKKGKLYRSVGLLAGVMVAIMFS